MKLFKFVFSSIFVAMLAGCVSDDADFVKTEGIKTGNPFGVELTEALECANSILGQIEGDATRSAGRRVKSTHPILVSNASKTRSADLPDTLFYLVNYENNEGFAVLAADRRLSPVLAISEDGQLAMSDTLFNEPLRLFFEAAMADAETVLATSIPTIQPDTTIQPHPIVNVNRKTPPMLDSNVQKWGQRLPFNQYTPKVYDSQKNKYVSAPVGCVPLTIGAIMSFFEWPQNLNGNVYNWPLIKKYVDYDSMSRLLVELGNQMNTNYDYDVSNTSLELIPQGFINFGYTSCGSPRKEILKLYSALNLTELRNTIDYTPYPILMLGQHSEGWHSWVVDGGITYTYSYNGFDFEDDEHPSTKLLHCCWGWYGASNGYFQWDVKHQSIKNNQPYTPDSGSVSAPNEYEFSNIQYFIGYSPIK